MKAKEKSAWNSWFQVSQFYVVLFGVFIGPAHWWNKAWVTCRRRDKELVERLERKVSELEIGYRQMKRERDELAELCARLRGDA